MSASAPGLEVRSGSRVLRDAAELLSSMRFAIALLTIICIASVIGTVVKQHEPFNNYVNQFGPFWAEVFGTLNLYAVYSAWWFLLILAFLVASTSLCVARHTPKILADVRTYKEQVREQSLQSFRHKAAGTLAETPQQALDRLSRLLQRNGWKARAQVREQGVMIGAKKGAANKLGYIAAHSAIVLICVGGLLDGDMIVRAQLWLADKTPYFGGGTIRDVPARHRLGPTNPTFRGNMLVAEGGVGNAAVLNLADGVVIQELPFSVELKKFIVDYYDSGMPKLFASEIVIHDHDTGEKIPATVKVNEPAYHRGIAIYQSSFDDGGSKLTLQGHPLGRGPAGAPFEVAGEVGGSLPVRHGNETFTLEFTGLRVINVENMGEAGSGSATDVRRVDLVSNLESHLGSGVKTRTELRLSNIGPSVSYKLRDASGQAREFNNYMLPVEIDGERVFLAGMRESPAEPFRYLRIPADDQGSLDGWMRLREALHDEALRHRAVARYVAAALPQGRPELAEQLTISARRSMSLFAGDEALKSGEPSPGGLQAISEFIETNVPEAERAKASEVLIRIMNGVLFELLQVTREQAGLQPLPPDETTQAFMTQAVLSLSDAFFYPAPVLFQLKDFTQVQASVFQLARAPGKYLVYAGCLFLIIGVFAMLYVKERRLWIWLQPAGEGTQLTAALSTTRQTLDVDREFDDLRQHLLDHRATPRASETA